MNNIEFTIPFNWMRVETAAAYLGLSPRTINRYRKSGRIPASRISERTYLYRREDLDEFASTQPKLFNPNPQQD